MWDYIIYWFGNYTNRREIIKHFNQSAKKAYLAGEVETLFKANISIGDMDYSHRLSKFLRSGYSIKAISGKSLTETEVIEIGDTILANKLLVRKFITLGWDTLTVQDVESDVGKQWNIQAFSEELHS